MFRIQYHRGHIITMYILTAPFRHHTPDSASTKAVGRPVGGGSAGFIIIAYY